MERSNPATTGLPKPVTRSGLSFPVVGIGASAGGLAAVIRLLESLPASPGMAFVVIFHLSPKHESSAADILQRSTAMRVQQVNGPTSIEADHVYVIPPTHCMTMFAGHLSLGELRQDRGRQVVIDLFFRTLAQAHQERSIAVVLTGTGADGAVGIAEVKELGGIVMAQSPGEAEFDAMPNNAIATGQVDIVLPVPEIAQKLLDLWSNMQRIELPSAANADIEALPPTSPQAAEQALQEVMALLHQRTGHDFKHYKRATVLRRIERRLQVNSLPHLPRYLEFLRANPAETALLLGDMLIGVTNFFRDREAFEAVERLVVPDLFREELREDQLRVWVAGCSSGEEVYSLLMLCCHEEETTPHPRPIQFFGSDIDATAIAKSREARYPQAVVTDIPPIYMKRYMGMDDGQYRVAKALREKVLFADHNVLRDPPFSRLDMVSCRNLLIYLDREVQKEILQLFHFALRPGGYLFLGSSETAEASSTLFTTVDKKHRIYRANATARPVRALPRFPLGTTLQRAVAADVRPTRNALSAGDFHNRLLEDFAPPSILLRADGEILHTTRAGQYLQFGSGVPSQHLPTLILPPLRPLVRTALFEAAQTNGPVRSHTVRIEVAGQWLDVSLSVQPVQHPDWSADVLLLIFHQSDAAPVAPQGESGTSGHDPLVATLEAELQRRDAQMPQILQQYETSVEDLKASNEELQAINEELRSATEELETSREELQSTNEELITVNHELKLKAEETAEVNDDLKNFISSTEIATIFVERDMRIKRFTPAAATIFNIIPSDMGRSLLDITHKLDYDALSDDVAAAFAALRIVEREVSSTDGRWFLARMLPYRTTADRIEGSVLTFVDVTSRRDAERSMHIDQERMQLIASSMPDFAIMTFDENGLFTSWSAGAERMLGFSEQDVLGQPASKIFVPEDVAAGVPEEELRQAVEFGRAVDERWHLCKDGSRIFVSGITSPMRLGRLKGFAKIARDMTARQAQDHSTTQALHSAERSARSAEAANQLKDEFLAVMSHELKHPLNLIQVNAQLLLASAEVRANPSLAKIGKTIQSTVRTQARIIDDLLDISRSRTGKLVLDASPVFVEEALQSSLQWAGQQAALKDIRFEADLPQDPVLVMGDPVRLEQIAMNLLGNAIKFTRASGTVTVRLFVDGTEAVLSVRDSGRGISDEFLPHVFDLFRQDRSHTTREEGGLGIGLALVRDLVALHGGRVDAASPGAGRGATFTVRLPLHERTDFGQLDEAPAAPTWHGIRVLYVDDTPDTLESFAMLLALQGADVLSALGGADALEQSAGRTFDLIISDIGMPLMDGYELIARLRARPETEAVPAIALTGYGRPQEIERALRAGFDAHLNKPVEFERLTALMERLLTRTRGT